MTFKNAEKSRTPLSPWSTSLTNLLACSGVTPKRASACSISGTVNPASDQLASSSNAERRAFTLDFDKPNLAAISPSMARRTDTMRSAMRCTISSSSSRLSFPDPSRSTSSSSSAMLCCSLTVRGCNPSDMSTAHVSRMSNSPLRSRSCDMNKCTTSSLFDSMSMARNSLTTSRYTGNRMTPLFCAVIRPTTCNVLALLLLETKPKSSSKLRISCASNDPLESSSSWLKCWR
mmetsp:Transcript_58141/g.168810  ORF Transcript_58141/g.168810 Transcript_58141/m.168810 type:complete len:232 (-) Transcript_58141:1024-1719(-)